MILRDALQTLLTNPGLQPQKDAAGNVVTTHCNQGARIAAQSQGCKEFDDTNLDAEAMGRIMAQNLSSMWLKVDGEAATARALAGKLAFAFMSRERLGEAHAHIATIYPTPMGHSGSLDKDVPWCLNVGVNVKQELVTAAFPVSKGEPDYFIWVG